MKAFLSWSGGKDSAMAYLIAKDQLGYKIDSFLVNFDKKTSRVLTHGTREEIIKKQALLSGVSMIPVAFNGFPSNSEFETQTGKMFTKLKDHGYTHAIFGDIFLEDIKNYRENLCRKHRIEPVFPLWMRETRILSIEILIAGIESTIASIDTNYLEKNYLGSKYNSKLISDLPSNVDPCGERGEFHTIVTKSPFFDSELKIKGTNSFEIGFGIEALDFELIGH